MYFKTKYLLSICSLMLFCFSSYSQTPDTIYVDQVDTILVKEPDVILNKTVYQEQSSVKKNKKIGLIASIGGATDFTHYEYCKSCEENFKTLKSSLSNAKSFQLGGQINYLYKKFSIGLELNYRKSTQHINYTNDSIHLNSNLNITYFMLGPSISYRILRKQKWDIDLSTSLLFSFTLKQNGQTIGGENINEIINVDTKNLISEKNIVYHFAPVLTYKINTSISLLCIAHYYLDIHSNVATGQSYATYRNTIGMSFGIKYQL